MESKVPDEASYFVASYVQTWGKEDMDRENGATDGVVVGTLSSTKKQLVRFDMLHFFRTMVLDTKKAWSRKRYAVPGYIKSEHVFEDALRRAATRKWFKFVSVRRRVFAKGK